MDRVKSVRSFAAKAPPARWRYLCLLVAPLVLLAAGPAEAKKHLATTTFKVTVTVVEPPRCVINENRPIEVDFGQVQINRIDGVNYRVPVVYSLDCGDSQDQKMVMSFTGGTVDFDSAALRTSVDGLGIRLYGDDQVLEVNNGTHEFDYPNTPTLFAVPVKQDDAELSGGEFTAAATLKVDYR